MNEFEISRNITRPVKGTIIVMLVLTFIVVLIPLWQIGSRSSVSREITVADSGVADLDAEGRALKAAIAADLSADESYIISASAHYQNLQHMV